MCGLRFGQAKLPSLGADEKLRGRSAVQDYLARLSSAEKARRANKPLMAYFHVRTSGTPGGRKTKLTRQATACRDVDRLFDGRDTGIGTAAKFFVVSKVDVSKVGPRENPLFNMQTAPAIALVDSKGNLVSLLSGKIYASALLKAMMQTLARSGIGAAKIAVGRGILDQISKLENERVPAERRRAAAQKALAEARKKRYATRVASQQAVLRKAEEALERVTKALAEQEKLWADLFKG